MDQEIIVGVKEHRQDIFGRSPMRIAKQEGSLWILFHSFFVFLVCIVEPLGANHHLVPLIMNLDLLMH